MCTASCNLGLGPGFDDLLRVFFQRDQVIPGRIGKVGTVRVRSVPYPQKQVSVVCAPLLDEKRPVFAAQHFAAVALH
jgi:hypothetical protein